MKDNFTMHVDAIPGSVTRTHRSVAQSWLRLHSKSVSHSLAAPWDLIVVYAVLRFDHSYA
jgi:hypothetical protein